MKIWRMLVQNRDRRRHIWMCGLKGRKKNKINNIYLNNNFNDQIRHN